MKVQFQQSSMDHWVCIAPSGTQCTRFAEIPKYAEGLYDLNNQIYAWMVPNGSWGESNAGLIVGDGASLLVDTLYDVNYTQAMLDAMCPLYQAAPLKYVVNTHADGDHCWGNELVLHSEIITSQSSYNEMLTMQPQFEIWMGRVGKLLNMLPMSSARRAGHWLHSMVAPYDFKAVTHTPATRTFKDELTLDVGGREVQLIEVGPAHTLGDLMVYIPDTKTLFSGDIIFIGSTPVTWTGLVENWLAALDKILDMDIDVIVPGHGPVTDMAGIRDVRAYWEYVAGRVQTCFAAGMSATEAAREIVLNDDYARQPFGNWNSPERVMTNAHVMYRRLQGRTEPPQVSEWGLVLWETALLAHELPNAQPAVMRQR